MKTRESSGEVATGFLLSLIALFLAAPVRAWATIKIYDWHVRPVFGGPQWHVLQVWALFVFVQMVLPWTAPNGDKNNGKSVLELGAEAVVVGLGGPLMGVLMGWPLQGSY